MTPLKQYILYKYNANNSYLADLLSFTTSIPQNSDRAVTLIATYDSESQVSLGYV